MGREGGRVVGTVPNSPTEHAPPPVVIRSSMDEEAGEGNRVESDGAGGLIGVGRKEQLAESNQTAGRTIHAMSSSSSEISQPKNSSSLCCWLLLLVPLPEPATETTKETCANDELESTWRGSHAPLHQQAGQAPPSSIIHPFPPFARSCFSSQLSPCPAQI